MIDLEKTQHYTKQAAYILQGLERYIPSNVLLIEPFAGEGDLVSLFPQHNWETYDIDSAFAAIQQDTLLSPPDYVGKWVITNPPFLAKNKAKNKELFKKYELDDYYKIALHTFIGCEGGIVITPLNFLTDEYSEKIRKEFLSQYRIDAVNIFKKPVFESTTYSVCCFAFHKEQNKEQQFECFIPEENETFIMRLEEVYGYRYGGEYFATIENQKSVFSRLLKDEKEIQYITNLKLYGLDTRSEPIHIAFETSPYYGKSTDRVYATFVAKEELSEELQFHLMNEFNRELNAVRKQFHNLIFTNYRDYNRKRISFDFAYKLLSKILEKEKLNNAL